jgi:ankyrin repeat protein
MPFQSKQNNLFEKLTKKDKPYLIIINGIDLPKDILGVFLKNMQSLWKRLEENKGRVIFTSTTKYNDADILKTLKPHTPPKTAKKEIMKFIDYQLEQYPEAKEKNRQLKIKSPERHDYFMNLLCKDYGDFPGIVESIIRDLEKSSDTTIEKTINAMEISATGHELTEKFAICYKKSFKNLSDEARWLLLYLLNFNFDEYTSIDKLKEDVNAIFDERYKEEFSREELKEIKDKITSILKPMGSYKSNEFIDELVNTKFIHTDKDKEAKRIKIADTIIYKMLLFEDVFSKEGLREKLVSEKRILKVAIMDYLNQEVDLERKKEILKLRLNRLNMRHDLSGIKYEDGCNILHGVARFCVNTEILDFLMDNWPSLFYYTTQYGERKPTVDNRGQTALHYAAAGNCNPKILESLLQKAKECGLMNYLNFPSNIGNSVIHFAAEFNQNQEIMRFILGQDELLNETINQQNDYGLTPLLYACWKNTPEIVKLLLARSDIMIKTAKSQNLLDICVFYPNTERKMDDIADIIDIINDYTGEDLFRSMLREKDDEGNTPLHYAVRFIYDNIEILKKLYRSADDLNAVTVKGFTPLHNAAGYNSSEVVSFLVKNGAKIDNHSDDSADNVYPIHYAAEFSRKQPKIAEILCGTNKEMINIPDKYGDRPLHYAVAAGNSEMIIKLINLGADKNIPNKRNFTSLHLAIGAGQSSQLIGLLATPGNINLRTDEEFNESTPLLLALNPPKDIKVNRDIVRELLRYKADVEKADSLGNTPLHYAVITCPDLVVIEKLITKNTINNRNWQGNTPLIIAQRLGTGRDVVQKLLSADARM